MSFFVYTPAMGRRTTIEVDDALLTEAQQALGTRGLKATVERAFREAIRRSLRERLAERIESGAGVDRSPEVLKQSRPAR
jgi:Arc/MetJ family transcription regulator